MMMPSWFAIYTEPQREQLANEQLKARHFTTLFPHTLDWIGLKTAFARLVRRAYYPRYLFVETEMICFAGLRDCPGVIGPVKSTDGMPFRLAQEAVQAILDKTDCLGAVHEIPASRVKHGLYRGNRVKLDLDENHPLWNLATTIADIDGDDITATLGRLKVRFKASKVGEMESRGTSTQTADHDARLAPWSNIRR